MARRERFGAAEARRIALAAQGFDRPRPPGGAGRRDLRRVLEAVGLLQIDSVNVLQRAHYLPPFSRLGPYPSDLLDDMAYAGRELFEYWGHVASLLPMRLWPCCRWRMERLRGTGAWGQALRLMAERPGYVESVLAEVRERGPLAARDLTDPGGRAGQWWGWGDGKVALESLFAWGDLAVAKRVNFERYYDLTERVIPAAVLAAPRVEEADARREMLRVAARALGIATAGELFDYFRLKAPDTKPALAELVDSGELLPVEVAGWARQAYLWHAARVPRSLHAQALVSPFDSLVFERSRTERVFGFRYRIEIYVPAKQRIYGYYVLPFLLGDSLVGRVDLKADRKSSTLLVQAAHGEPGVGGEAAEPLAAELSAMADWLGLERVQVSDRGEMAPALRARLHQQAAAPVVDLSARAGGARRRVPADAASRRASTASGRRGR